MQISLLFKDHLLVLFNGDAIDWPVGGAIVSVDDVTRMYLEKK